MTPNSTDSSSDGPHPAKWIFAWWPVRTEDTERLVWLKVVYREWWGRKFYFEFPSYTVNSNQATEVRNGTE